MLVVWIYESNNCIYRYTAQWSASARCPCSVILDYPLEKGAINSAQVFYYFKAQITVCQIDNVFFGAMLSHIALYVWQLNK